MDTSRRDGEDYKPKKKEQKKKEEKKAAVAPVQDKPEAVQEKAPAADAVECNPVVPVVNDVGEGFSAGGVGGADGGDSLSRNRSDSFDSIYLERADKRIKDLEEEEALQLSQQMQEQMVKFKEYEDLEEEALQLSQEQMVQFKEYEGTPTLPEEEITPEPIWVSPDDIAEDDLTPEPIWVSPDDIAEDDLQRKQWKTESGRLSQDKIRMKNQNTQLAKGIAQLEQLQEEFTERHAEQRRMRVTDTLLQEINESLKIRIKAIQKNLPKLRFSIAEETRNFTTARQNREMMLVLDCSLTADSQFFPDSPD